MICEYCGAEFSTPLGWSTVVERTMDMEPPAHVAVLGVAPGIVARDVWHHGSPPPIFHQCRKGKPVVGV